MTIMARSAQALMGLCLLAMAGCGEDGGPAEPEPGTLVATLATPNTDDGAILVRLTGSGITQVSAEQAGMYLRMVQNGDTVTAVVVGDVVAGALLSFHVPDVNDLHSCSATVLQVADAANVLRGSLSGYALSLAVLGS